MFMLFLVGLLFNVQLVFKQPRCCVQLDLYVLLCVYFKVASGP